MLQAAIAAPDEGGTMVVHSATQSLDTVQRAVARTLGVSLNKVPLASACRSTKVSAPTLSSEYYYAWPF